MPLQLYGNGGPIRYFGGGSVINTTNSGAALFATDWAARFRLPPEQARSVARTE